MHFQPLFNISTTRRADYQQSCILRVGELEEKRFRAVYDCRIRKFLNRVLTETL
jgi:hypothetical protein